MLHAHLWLELQCPFDDTNWNENLCGSTQITNLQNRKTLRADSYHQAVAERFCRYVVIEGFQSLGRITGFEVKVRFNRPLKRKAIHPLRMRENPLPLPLTCSCTLGDLFTFILNQSHLRLTEQKPTHLFLDLLPSHILSESSESVKLLNPVDPQSLHPIKIEDFGVILFELFLENYIKVCFFLLNQNTTIV